MVNNCLQHWTVLDLGGILAFGGVGQDHLQMGILCIRYLRLLSSRCQSLHYWNCHCEARGHYKAHFILGGWLVFLWFLYPIAWGLDDGGNEIKVTSGFIFFGILDVLMVPVLAFGFLVLARNWDFRALNIYFTQYGRVAPGEFAERDVAKEKTVPVEPSSVVEPTPEQAV